MTAEGSAPRPGSPSGTDEGRIRRGGLVSVMAMSGLLLVVGIPLDIQILVVTGSLIATTGIAVAALDILYSEDRREGTDADGLDPIGSTGQAAVVLGGPAVALLGIAFGSQFLVVVGSLVFASVVAGMVVIGLYE